MNERDLIDGIVERDRQALVRFYHTYTPKLVSYIHHKVSNPKDAEEVLQDALFAFLEAARDFTGSVKLTTFLFAIANHKIIDYYRKKKIVQVVFSRYPRLEHLVSPLLNPEESYDAVMVKEKIHKTFRTILPHYKTLLQLRYFDNLPIKEIASRLSLTLKGAESQIFRARKAFVEAFISI